MVICGLQTLLPCLDAVLYKSLIWFIPSPPGGLGEAVLSAVGREPGVVVTRLAVAGVPRSGKPQELLDLFGISAKHIANAVRQTFAN